MNTNFTQLSDQVTDLIAEAHGLRIKSRADDETITVLKLQCQEMADEITTLRREYEAEIKQTKVENSIREHNLRVERDRAVTAYTQINGILNRTADLLVQALRARDGDKTPAEIPDVSIEALADTRLPPVSMTN